jgi:hypothetical protein
MVGVSAKPRKHPRPFVLSTARTIERLSTDDAACSPGAGGVSTVPVMVDVQNIADDVSRLAHEAAGAAVIRWRSAAASEFRVALGNEVRALHRAAAALRSLPW